MKLKKIASLALAGVMAVSMLAGCSDKGNGGDNNNGGNTVVEPSTSSIVTAFNDGQDEGNKVKVTFSSDASLNAALQKAVTEAGSFATVGQIKDLIDGLQGKVYDELKDFATASTLDDDIKDKQTKTVMGVMSLPSSTYWTETDAVNNAARMMNESIAKGFVDGKTTYTLDADNAQKTDKEGETYYTFSYTGTVSMVSAQQESGSTAYYVVFTITQTATKNTVKA